MSDQETISVTPADFNRLEGKVDQMATAVAQLVLIEDRQTRHTVALEKGERRMDEIEKKHAEDKAATDKELVRVDRRIDKWLHLGMGAMFIVSVGWQIFTALHK